MSRQSSSVANVAREQNRSDLEDVTRDFAPNI
jgi:hypothetical protein